MNEPIINSKSEKHKGRFSVYISQVAFWESVYSTVFYIGLCLLLKLALGRLLTS